ncbi:MAG: Mut7-C RNAse domain-containing protein [Candidatus Thorarchaeota archaeon]
MTENQEKKFVVDIMYQRLGRFLRVLGYDTVIDADLSDNDQLELAVKENRIVLTRDELMGQIGLKKGLQIARVDAPTIEERIANLALQTEIDLELNDGRISRCTVCNSPIKIIDKKEIEKDMLEGTKDHYDQFWICTNNDCQQIYWKGPHWVKMKESLEISKKLLEEKKNKILKE